MLKITNLKKYFGGVSLYHKIYKQRNINNIRMFPSDLSRSLDVFFLDIISKIVRRFNNGRDYSFY